MRICVIGMGPWPTEQGAVVTAPAIRVRLFAEPFIKARYEVNVILLEDQRRENVPVPGAYAASAFTPEDILDPAVLKNAMDLSHVSAVFGVGSLMPATAACRLAKELDAACWADLNGDPLAELHAMQLRQGGKPDIVTRDHIWKLMREALLCGDMFSTVSGPQRHALLGQLGLLGRYEDHWDICKRIHEMPGGVPEEWTHPLPLPAFPEVLREHGLKEGDRYVFFGGSWNVWMDDVSMGRALAAALEADPGLYFIACGIPTGPAGEQVRGTIMRSVGVFKEAGRVLDLPPQHMGSESALLAHAGACLSMDRPIPESELGARTRLLPMVRWGARPVVTAEAEIEAVLVAEGLAAGAKEANAERAAKEILAACSRTKDEREADRRHGLEWLRTATFDRIAAPAIEWVRRGASRWPQRRCDGLLDRWAEFPADPEKLFPSTRKGKMWFFR